jgi:hypothetical protein
MYQNAKLAKATQAPNQKAIPKRIPFQSKALPLFVFHSHRKRASILSSWDEGSLKEDYEPTSKLQNTIQIPGPLYDQAEHLFVDKKLSIDEIKAKFLSDGNSEIVVRIVVQSLLNKSKVEEK